MSELLKTCVCGAQVWHTKAGFTVAEGIKIQQDQLRAMDNWVKPELMVKLREHCDYCNKAEDLRCGHDVFRGQDLEFYLQSLI